MTDEQLINLIDRCPHFTQEQKELYTNLLEKDLPEDQAEEARELIRQLIREKENFHVLTQRLEEYKKLQGELGPYIEEARQSGFADQEEMETPVPSAGSQEQALAELSRVVKDGLGSLHDIVARAEKEYVELFKSLEQDKIKKVKKDLEI